MREEAMAVGQLDPEHRIRQQLDNFAFYLDSVFSRHVSISGSDFVTRIVCSKCADGLRSEVTTVQPSWRIFTALPPMFTIGSIAKIIPAFSFGPLPLRPKFGTCGSSCSLRPTPWPTNSRTTL